MFGVVSFQVDLCYLLQIFILNTPVRIHSVESLRALEIGHLPHYDGSQVESSVNRLREFEIEHIDLVVVRAIE
jgi:hypothetical protein